MNTSKYNKKNNIIFDSNSGKTLQEGDLVSMNFWICKNDFFIFLENYIIQCIRVKKY